MLPLNLSSKREKAYSEGDFDQVISIALKQLKANPDDIKTLNDLAVAYHRKGMMDEAFEVCRQINVLHPTTNFSRQFTELGDRYMRYHLIMGKILYARGRYDEALAICADLKFLKGRFADKFHLSAQIYLKRGDAEKAVHEYDTMLKWRPELAEQVIEGLQTIIDKFPRHKKAHRLQIEVYGKQGQLKKILADGEQAVQRGTADPATIYRLGFHYQFEGQDARALEFFGRYAQNHPDDQEVRWFFGDLLVERGEYEKALREYRQIVEKDPVKLDSALAKLEMMALRASDENRALVLPDLISFNLRAGNLSAVRKWLDSLLPAVRADNGLRVKLENMLAAAGDDCLDAGDLDSTKVILDQLLLLDPSNDGYRTQLRNLDEVLLQKKIPELEERLRTGLLSEQETCRALHDLGEAYNKQGESGEKVFAVYQQLARFDSPFQPDALMRLGLTFLHKGLGDLAEQQFEKLLRVSLPDARQTQYAYEIGLAYENGGLPEKARECYKRILQIDVNYRDAAQRLERCSKPARAAADGGTVSTTSPMALVEERYDRIVKVGGGGMGTVFRAVDRVLRREVALKFINQEYRTDPEAVARFIREAQAASHLRHSGIVAIYDIHVQEPLYIAMEYVEGGTLRDALKQGGLSVEEVSAIAVQLCEALGYAHSHEVVHRDIKPDNILMAKGGGVKIADFGLARIAEYASAMTRAGQIMGTPVYMAPEQILGKAVDGRTDIYAFGVMLYELLTKRVPFDEGDIAYRHIHEAPMLPGLINPMIPKKLEAIVLTCLQKRPEDRYQNMEAVGRDLRSLG